MSIHPGSQSDADNDSYTDPTIRKWLAHRQELVLLYFANVGLDKVRFGTSRPEQRASTLCQSLVDYLSMGHFMVYEHLLKTFDRPSQESERARIERTFERIQNNTQACVSFNDRYEDCAEQVNVDTFFDDLSRLGSELESRFAAEDELLSLLGVTGSDSQAA
jgi:regulator of sigma D